MAVSKRLRFEVLRRDNHTCRYCGGTAPDVMLTVDHVVPMALGGSDEPSNLVAACRDCNAGKSSTPVDAQLVDDVAQDALRWARAMEQVAELRKSDRNARIATKFWFTGVWNNWTNWRDETFELPDEALDSIIRFLSSGLDKPQMEELVRVAMRSQSPNKWRYFCGCCWNRIRQNADMAAEILNGEDATNG